MTLNCTIPNFDVVDLDKKAYRQVISRALNKAAAQAKTEASSLVRQAYNIKKADLDAGLSIDNANSNDLQTTITARGKRIPLIEFGAIQFSGGTRFQIKIGGKALLPHAFVATMKSGHVGVFERVQGKFMRENPKRQAIDQLYTISAAEMFNSKFVIDGMEKKIEDIFPGLLEHEMEYYMSQN